MTATQSTSSFSCESFLFSTKAHIHYISREPKQTELFIHCLVMGADDEGIKAHTLLLCILLIFFCFRHEFQTIHHYVSLDWE